jgi:hypothetical protein
MQIHIRLTSRCILALLVLALAVRYEAAADTPAAAVPLPAADKAQLEALLGPGIVGDALPGLPLGAVDSYLPAKGTPLSYQVLDAKKQPTAETHKVDDTTDPAFSPGWRYTVEGVGVDFFMTGPDGGVVIVAEQDLDHKVLTRFTPGEPLIVPGLKPGESKTAKLSVSVYDLSDLKKVTHSGSLDVTYTYVGAYRVKVPAGSYDAALIRWNYSGKVGPATIKDSQYRFLAPNAGMVAMIQIRSISAMLLYNDHTKLGKVLAHAP